MARTKIQGFASLATLVLVTVAFLWLLSLYYGAIQWAVILAILFDPLQRRLEGRLGGRRNLAAALSVLACICVVVIPGTLILAASPTKPPASTPTSARANSIREPCCRRRVRVRRWRVGVVPPTADRQGPRRWS